MFVDCSCEVVADVYYVLCDVGNACKFYVIENPLLVAVASVSSWLGCAWIMWCCQCCYEMVD